MRLLTVIIIFFFAARAVLAQESNEPAGQIAQAPESGQTLQTPEEQARQAVDDPNKPAALEDYLRYAQLHNERLKSCYQEWQDALKGVPADTVLDPKLTYGYYIKDEDIHVEQERQRVGFSQSIGIFGMKEAEGIEAQATAEATRFKYEAAKLQLIWEVKEAFYEYAHLAQAIEITQEHLSMIERLEEISRQREWCKAGAHIDIKLAELEKSRLEDILNELERQKGPAAAGLNKAISRDENAELAQPVLEEFEPIRVNHTVIADILRQKNPQLAQLDKEIEAARNKVTLAKAQSYPEIGVGIDFIRTERAIAANIRPDEKDPTFFMLSMKVPLLRDSYEAQRKATAEIRKKEQERMEAENSILTKAMQVINDYEDSILEMRLYRQGVLVKNKELMNLNKNRYNAKGKDFTGLIDTEQILLFYRLGYERASVNNRLKLAELELLAGTKLDDVQLKN
jgi:outer membrane protein TolC